MNQGSPRRAQNDQAWRDDAECQSSDPFLFLARERNVDGEGQRIAVAKSVCRRCPVTAECFNFAVSLGSASGVFGGEVFSDGRVGNR